VGDAFGVVGTGVLALAFLRRLLREVELVRVRRDVREALDLENPEFR
jgi:hypothetical protein